METPLLIRKLTTTSHNQFETSTLDLGYYFSYNACQLRKIRNKYEQGMRTRDVSVPKSNKDNSTTIKFS